MKNKQMKQEAGLNEYNDNPGLSGKGNHNQFGQRRFFQKTKGMIFIVRSIHTVFPGKHNN